MLDNNISKNKQLIINIISSLIAFGANIVINFFLSPYIVKTLGVEANGFVSLANTFITYATLVTIALNSMAGRFITIAIHRDDYKSANKYYNGVFLGNMITTIVLFIPAVVLVSKLENFINIPNNLIIDVKILFTVLFLNFFISVAVPIWNVATFVKNKIYLNSIRTVEANLLKVIVIIFLFILFVPHVYYVGIATILCTIYITIFNWHYKRKLLPELKINKKYFEFSAIKELISSGIWNTVSQAGIMLLNGLDLLISNLFIGPVEMGILSLAKTAPTIMTNLAGTLKNVFAPTLTIDYAKGNKELLKKDLKQGMKLTNTILTIPIAILIVYGIEFYSLWVPTQDAKKLQILSILTCIGFIFTSGTQCLYNIFTVVNKVKVNSLLLLLSGVINILIVLILLKTTNLGVYAVAGVSSFVNLVRNMCYTVPFTAKYIGVKWNSFFPEVMSSIISVIILIIFGRIIKNLLPCSTWTTLFVTVIIFSIIAFILNILIILNKEERKKLFNMFKRKFKIGDKIKRSNKDE